MKKYVEFEKQTINAYKRGLINFVEAINLISGYLTCLVDVGMLDASRFSEEFRISTKKLLDSEK